jgi:polyphosphate glucokinase
MKILVIDIGGTNLKIALNGQKEPIKVPSGPTLTPTRMVAGVKQAIAGQTYDVVSVGYPGPVVDGQPVNEPKNLARGWVRFNYEKAFGKPVRMINDAAMQALGSHQGGRMLFLGLGTGLGTALVVDGIVAPLELAHLPYRRGTYEDYVGLRGYDRMGRRKWEKHVHTVVELLMHALQVDYVVLGGGQTKKLKSVPAGARVGDNANAIVGGVRLWAAGKGVPVSARSVHSTTWRKA